MGSMVWRSPVCAVPPSMRSNIIYSHLLLWIFVIITSQAATSGDTKNTASLGFDYGMSRIQQWASRRYPSQVAFTVEHGETADTWTEPLSHPEVPSSYTALLDALHVMESHFFSVAHGTWPQAIDWTAAVMGTQVSASLSAMSECSKLPECSELHVHGHENLINRYFTQVTSFYFGENAFSLRTQAYDDMLWVVLGWLESIKFVNKHSTSYHGHFTSQEEHGEQTSDWYARQFIPQFAHRSRLFYDLASKGWDTTLCGGGMIWNPHLAPYKNAITNQLFIAASVSMYLYFPGDHNASPFASPTTVRSGLESSMQEEDIPPAKAYDGRYLRTAIEAYDWLKRSGMRNKAGLYADGFHIRGWRGGRHGSNGTGHCDLREEQVYTYNQGVVLSALRDLWAATGKLKYLEDGHELINDVTRATGWANRDTDQKYRWEGLGRNGILEEQCDWSGSCSQNGQTFKGIFFHHFTFFCSPLPSSDDDESGNGHPDRPWLDDDETRALHQQSCDGYQAWITANARAAWDTRDDEGEFGQWWGRPWPGRRPNPRDHNHQEQDWSDDSGDSGVWLEPPPDDSNGRTDYKNDGVPVDAIWRITTADAGDCVRRQDDPQRVTDQPGQRPVKTMDLNDRGRGRTVETQSGGVAVTRALWKLVESRKRSKKDK